MTRATPPKSPFLGHGVGTLTGPMFQRLWGRSGLIFPSWKGEKPPRLRARRRRAPRPTRPTTTWPRRRAAAGAMWVVPRGAQPQLVSGFAIGKTQPAPLDPVPGQSPAVRLRVARPRPWRSWMARAWKSARCSRSRVCPSHLAARMPQGAPSSRQDGRQVLFGYKCPLSRSGRPGHPEGRSKAEDGAAVD